MRTNSLVCKIELDEIKIKSNEEEIMEEPTTEIQKPYDHERLCEEVVELMNIANILNGQQKNSIDEIQLILKET